MADIEELELQKMELEEKISSTRNSMVKAEYADEIKLINKHIEEIRSGDSEKEITIQKEAPAIIDHVETKHHTRGDIVNSGSTFIGII